jgi:hypothetical protein
MPWAIYLWSAKLEPDFSTEKKKRGAMRSRTTTSCPAAPATPDQHRSLQAEPPAKRSPSISVSAQRFTC